MKYRSEIDGLRAVAVIPVILFHAGFEAFAGGFVGVDVFFVLSGYLITSILLAEIAEGRFSIVRFYERRARRILPALYFVMLVSVPFAAWLMLPDEFTGFAQGMVSVLLFVSNIHLWRNTDYFSRAAEENPLLHTWSLAVEEQYYMLFPLGLLLLWRLGGRRAALAGLVAGALASLALAEYGWRQWPVPNFFLLPSRAWELGIGALAAFHLHGRDPAAAPVRFAGVLAGLGLAMILASILLFDARTPFPSLYALLPTVGTLLVVLFAGPDGIAGRALSLRPFVFVGLISYSAYLWHQPLFAFARLASLHHPGTALMLGLSLLALVLGWATWRFVERPFRDRTRVSPRGILVSGLAATLGLFAIAGTIPLLARSAADYPAALRQFVIPLEVRTAYVETGYDRLTGAEFVADGRPKLLLIGDSFSQDLYNMIRETGAFADYQIITRRFQSVCQMHLGPEDISPLIEPHARYCADQLQARELLPVASEADVVMFAFSWRPWSGARAAETVARFGFRPDQKVFVLGRKQFGYFNPRGFLRMDPASFPAIRNRPSGEQTSTNAAMRSSVPPDQFIDLQAIICGDGPDCPLFTPAGELISFDGNHLTEAGARHVGALLFADPRLAPYAPPTRAAQSDGAGPESN